MTQKTPNGTIVLNILAFIAWTLEMTNTRRKDVSTCSELKTKISAKALSGAILLLVLSCSCGEPDTDPSVNSAFKDVTSKVKLDFIHDPAVDGNYFMPESIGSGAAFLDFDNDGDLDIYLLNGAHRNSTRDQKPPLRNRLYRQEDDGTFRDITDASGLGDPGYGMGIAVGDIDNDGFVDVYISNYGPDALYRNNGDGTFSNITRKAGIRNSEWGCSVVFFDFDRDNFLDIYVTNYLKYNPSGACTDRSGRQDYCGPAGFAGVPDKLYQNRGNATFLDISASSNIASGSSKGLGVVSGDFNGDNFPDLYVANDGEPNHLWLNHQNGTFNDQALVWGVALNDLGRAEAGMGIAMGDIDNDDDIDLLVTHLRTESNTLYRYAGEHGFQDDSFVSGLAGSSLPYTGFGTGFFDYDHDGDLDLAIVNGRVSRGPLLVATTPGYWDYYAEPNFMFENHGASNFRDISGASGFAETVENSRGLAFGDIDNDGDLDLLVTNCGGPARLFRNQTPNKGNWLIIKAVNPTIKRDAIGTKISVKVGENYINRTITPGYSYMSSSDPRAHFGLGSAESVDQVLITWPDGVREEFTGVQANQVITLRKGEIQ